MRCSNLIIAIALIAFAASTAAAQQADLHRTPVLDLTLARHQVSGGFVAFRTGASADLLVAGALRSTSRWALVGAAGGSAVVGGFGDICLIRPDGGCAPKANFVVANVLAGVDAKLGSASTRVLLGPALYDGADDSSVGAQIRVDLSSPTLEHVGLGAMFRATVLPSHDSQSLVAWAIGGSLIVQ
jgi:hypothetical protein